MNTPVNRLIFKFLHQKLEFKYPSGFNYCQKWTFASKQGEYKDW